MPATITNTTTCDTCGGKVHTVRLPHGTEIQALCSRCYANRLTAKFYAANPTAPRS